MKEWSRRGGTGRNWVRNRPLASGAGLFLLSMVLIAGRPLRSQETPLWALGNCSGDRKFDVSDAIMALDYLFTGGTRVPCVPLCDANGDGKLNLADPISILGYLFKGVPFRGRLPSPEEICDARDNDCNGGTDEGCPGGDLLAIDLAWDRVTRDVDGNLEASVTYRVHFGRQPGEYLETRDAGTATRFRVDGLVAGVLYYLSVTALDAAGNESRLSNEVSSLPKIVTP